MKSTASLAAALATTCFAVACGLVGKSGDPMGTPGPTTSSPLPSAGPTPTGTPRATPPPGGSITDDPCGRCEGLTYCDLNSGQCVPGCISDAPCASGEVCDIERRECVCEAGSHRCEGACVPDDSALSCGDRCEPCPSGPRGEARCDAGACVLDCEPGARLCDGVCAPCPDGANGSLSCAGTRCVAECDLGFGFCDGACREDLPDLGLEDTDCDGVDGHAAAAVFVSAGTGHDRNAGTREAPVATLGRAIAIAARRAGRRQVYAAAGVYAEDLSLEAPVSVFGGYEPAQGWRRSRNARTVVRPGPLGVRIEAADGAVVWQLVDVEAAAASGEGASSYGMRLMSNAHGVRIEGSRIVAGAGAPGRVAYAPSPAEDGVAASGFSGARAPDCGDAPPAGDGGRGGIGARPESRGTELGSDGVQGAAAGGQDGGDPGVGGDGENCVPGGAHGRAGEPPVDATEGAHAAPLTEAMGALAGGQYQPLDGNDGAPGSPGAGGGGGGGGGSAGASCASVRDGGDGGGGGSGGCGGSPGRGGGGGGASIAVYLAGGRLESRGNTFVSGGGGDGGRGSAGGAGGRGGAGARGVSGPAHELNGFGGTGGRGGHGGDGGDGGGGAGGPSIGVYVQRAIFESEADDFEVGPAGSGGEAEGEGPAGPDGLRAEVYEEGVVECDAHTCEPVDVGSSCHPDAPVVAPEVVARRSGSLSAGSPTDGPRPGRAYDVYALQLSPHQEVLVELHSEDFDTYLLVLDESCEVLAEDDDGGAASNSRLLVTAGAAAVRRLVIVTAYGSGDLGDYVLELSP